MHIPTGNIHNIPDGVTIDEYAKSQMLEAADFVMLDQPPKKDCKRCKGTGKQRAGLFSRRFKPCRCAMR